jgi:hypothetical protein
MSNWLLPRNWWQTSAFGGSTLPFGDDDGWEDLDGDLELFLTIEELLTGQ